MVLSSSLLLSSLSFPTLFLTTLLLAHSVLSRVHSISSNTMSPTTINYDADDEHHVGYACIHDRIVQQQPPQTGSLQTYAFPLGTNNLFGFLIISSSFDTLNRFDKALLCFFRFILPHTHRIVFSLWCCFHIFSFLFS
jgi:hypothetical protein